MTKAELVNQISFNTGYDKTTVLNVVEAFMASVKKTMANGENIYLRGFGTLLNKTRKEKIARNISKNTTLVVPEHQIPAFKPSKEFLKEYSK